MIMGASIPSAGYEYSHLPSPDIYYSIIDGIKVVGIFMLLSLIYSIICLIIAFCGGLRKRNCLAYFITSFT